MGVLTKEEGGSGTTTRSIEEGEGAQWSERAASKGSNNMYERIDDTKRSGDFYKVQGM